MQSFKMEDEELNSFSVNQSIFIFHKNRYLNDVDRYHLYQFSCTDDYKIIHSIDK